MTGSTHGDYVNGLHFSRQPRKEETALETRV